MYKLLSLLGAIGTTVGSAAPISNLNKINQSSIMFKEDVTNYIWDRENQVKITGVVSTDARTFVLMKLMGIYPEYSKFLSEVLLDKNQEKFLQAGFEEHPSLPNIGEEFIYNVVIVATDASEDYEGSAIIQFTVSNPIQEINGNLGIYESQEIGSNWSTGMVWDSPNNDQEILLFNWKDYADTYSEFIKIYPTIHIDGSGSGYKMWTDSSYTYPTSETSPTINLADIAVDQEHTMRFWEVSDGSIQGSASTDASITIRRNESGEITISYHIHLHVMHLGSGWRYVGGIMELDNWSVSHI